MFTDPITGEIKNGIAKVRYSHEAMIDHLIATPDIRQNELAVIFDRSPGWISQIINSDAFQAALAERREADVDPIIQQSIKDRLQAVAAVSLEKVLDKLSGPITCTDDFLLQTAKLSTAALGYGAKSTGGATTNVAVVIQVPPKIASSREWAQAYQSAA